MKNLVNIAIIGLGQIGIYIYNELRTKKKEIKINSTLIYFSIIKSILLNMEETMLRSIVVLPS